MSTHLLNDTHTQFLFQAYSKSLDQKARSMVFEVNAAIGVSICMDAEDILVVSGKAATFHQGNTVNINI